MNARIITMGLLLSIAGISIPVFGQTESAGQNVIAFKDLEKQVVEELRKPAPQRNLPELLARLKAVKMPPGSSMAGDIAAWISAVEQVIQSDNQAKQILNDLDSSSERQKELAKRLAELQEQEKNPSTIKQVAAQGVLVESNMSTPNPANPKRYELRHIKTGKAVAVVLSGDGKYDLDKYIDQLVKVTGSAIFVKELGMDVIDIGSLTVIDVMGKSKAVEAAKANNVRQAKDNKLVADNNPPAGKAAQNNNSPVAPEERSGEVRGTDNANPQKTPEKINNDDAGRLPLETADKNAKASDNSAKAGSAGTIPDSTLTKNDTHKSGNPVPDVTTAKLQETGAKGSDKPEKVVSPVDTPTRLVDLDGGQARQDNPAVSADKTEQKTKEAANPAENSAVKPPGDLKSPANEIEFD